MEYILDGSKILGEKTYDLTQNKYTYEKDYMYDSNGDVVGYREFDNTSEYGDRLRYFYEKNLQGDIIGTWVGWELTLYGDGITYDYTDWGEVSTKYPYSSMESGFYYRGYYYDIETGLYYLNSRYYDPETGRFINADGVLDDRKLNTQNLYTYCGNNPINRVDNGGDFWDLLLDVVSVVSSVIDVINDPTDVGAWVGLAGDVADVLLPGVSGVGETVRAVNTGKKLIDAADTFHDAGKVVDNVTDTAKAVSKTKKAVRNSERASAVRKAWKNELTDVQNGGSGISRQWTKSERMELLQTGKVKGYQGHHMKSVKGYPDLAGDPNNIQFLTNKEHLSAHGGNWRNITHGRYNIFGE